MSQSAWNMSKQYLGKDSGGGGGGYGRGANRVCRWYMVSLRKVIKMTLKFASKGLREGFFSLQLNSDLILSALNHY